MGEYLDVSTVPLPDPLALLSSVAVAEPISVAGISEWFEDQISQVLNFVSQSADWILSRLDSNWPNLKNNIYNFLRNLSGYAIERWQDFQWVVFQFQVISLSTLNNMWGYLSFYYAALVERILPLVAESFGLIGGKVQQYAEAAISFFFGGIGGFLSKILSQVGAGLFNFFGSIGTFLASIGSQALGALTGFFGAAGKWLTDIGGKVWDAVSGWFTAVGGGLDKIQLRIDAALASFFTPAGTFFSQLAGGIAAATSAAWSTTGDLWQRFSGKIADGSTVVLTSLTSASLSIQTALTNQISGLSTNVSGFLDTWISKFFGWISDNFTTRWAGFSPPAQDDKPTLLEWVFAQMFSRLNASIEAAVTAVTGAGAINIASSETIARGMISTGGAVFVGLSAMTLARELLHPLKQLGLGNLAAVIFDLTDYKALTGAFLGVLSAVYIKQPLTYLYNSMARATLPNLASLTAMAGEYSLAPAGDLQAAIQNPSLLPAVYASNKAAFLAGGKYHGYTDAWLSRMYELADTPERYFPLRAIADSGDYDEPYFVTALVNSGYNPGTVLKLLGMLKRMALADVKGQYGGAAIKAYVNGLASEAQLRDSLDDQGYSPAIIDKLVRQAREARRVDQALDMIDFGISQFLAGKIDEAQLMARLQNQGLSWADSMTRVEMAKRKINLNPEREPLEVMQASLRTTALSLYTSGYLTADALKTRLTQLGYDADYVELWRQKADAEYRLNLNQLREQYLAEAYSKDQFPESIYRFHLVGLGIDPVKVNVIVDLANARKYTIPKPEAVPELSVGQLFEARDKGGLTTDQVRAELVSRGWETVDINALVVSYSPDPATLTTAQLLAAWKAGVMTESALRSALAGRLYQPAAIDLLIATERAGIKPPTPKEQKTLTLSQLNALVARGLLTPVEYVAALRALGYSELDVQRLWTLEWLKLNPPEERE